MYLTDSKWRVYETNETKQPDHTHKTISWKVSLGRENTDLT